MPSPRRDQEDRQYDARDAGGDGQRRDEDRLPQKPDVLQREWPRYLKKAKVIMKGLWHAGHDFNVGYKMVVSAIVLALAGATGEWLDLAVVAAATGLLLSGELFNTAIEQLCDVVSPGHDERVGVVKDVAATAAGTAMVFWLGVVVLEAVRLIDRLG